MTQDDRKDNKTSKDNNGSEISNVDLQFMGKTDEKAELNATVKAEARTTKAANNPGKSGLDKQDVAVAQSMDASDPPSTNMGDTEDSTEQK